MRLFLSGPILHVPDYNTTAFAEASAALRALGHKVFNPREIDGGDTSKPRTYYMRTCIQELLRSEGLVSLPRWSGSKGAHLERKVAEEIGIPVWNLAAFLKEQPGIVPEKRR
jgi:hypothetical protein